MPCKHKTIKRMPTRMEIEEFLLWKVIPAAHPKGVTIRMPFWDLRKDRLVDAIFEAFHAKPHAEGAENGKI